MPYTMFVALDSLSIRDDQKLNGVLNFRIEDIYFSPVGGRHGAGSAVFGTPSAIPINGKNYHTLYLLKAQRSLREATVVEFSNEQARLAKSVIEAKIEKTIPNIEYQVGILRCS